MFQFEQTTGTKADRYEVLIKQLTYLLEGETDWLANLANTASHLYQMLEQINWSGFYLMKKGELVLGPFMGKPACVRIPVGKGVCGTAVERGETTLVEDVHAFPGHIACDAASRSEIVIPIRVNGEIIGVLDIDSPIKSRFDEEDKKYLERYVEVLVEKTDWTGVLKR
jgi:GAF domain-containing protein